jgi:arylsulfatase A-like enzyme
MKRITRLLVVLLYFGIVVVCIIIAVKPGASIFFAKQTIDNHELVADSGFAYRYRLDSSALIYRLQQAYLHEDGHQLTRTLGNTVVNTGKGSYTVNKSSQGDYYLYLSSSDNTNPITNGKQYTLYLPFTFISRQLGIIYFLILLPGAIWFLVFSFRYSKQRSKILRSPSGVLQVVDDFFVQTGSIIRNYFFITWRQIKSKAGFWKRLFTITILSAYLYIFFEWIFFVTMPSFMSIMNLPAKLKVFLLSGLVMSILCVLLMVIFLAFEIFGVLFRISRFTQYIGALIPTVILSSITMLLIDNFTYTLFKFGISTSIGIGRIAYTILFLGIFIYMYWGLLGFLGMRIKEASRQHPSNRLSYFVLGLLVISIGWAIAGFNPTGQSVADVTSQGQSGASLPNILLLGSDGLSAQNISAYGYARDTTPRLRELAQSSLVAENAFPNSGNSPGSVISMFTGKLPTTTRVGFTPDILKGMDAFQHFPGILKSKGYSTYELGMPLYVDSYAFNLQNGFDMVNGRSQNSNYVGTFMQKEGYEESAYFINRITERVSDRLLHILFIREMENPYIQVTKPADKLDDQQKINQALDIFDQSQPWFVHIHLLGTHGDYFELQNQFFSKGEDQDQPWMTDFYDDSILSFDSYVGEVIDHLEATGQFDNTILIIYTDHAMRWQVNERILLIIHFPGGEFSGHVTQNVQNLDIAPTILDYMGLQEPEWMAGASILRGNLNSGRLIFSAFAGFQAYDENHIWSLRPEIYQPPFYQFDYINVINCQKWYQLDLRALTWEEGDVTGSTTTCTQGDVLSFEGIKQATADQLASDGFDISSLP